MSNTNKNSTSLSTQANDFIKLFRKQNQTKLPISLNNQLQQIEKQNPNQSSVNSQAIWDLQMQSQSAMQAEQLFGNLVPQAHEEQNKIKNASKNIKIISKQKEKKDKFVIQEQQKIIQTKSILKKGRITQEYNNQDNQQSQLSQQKQQIKQAPIQRKRTVKFQGILPLNAELQKKWNDPIQNQRKGKFDKIQQKILSEAVGKFLVSNDISLEQFENLLTIGQRSDKISKRQKIFSLLSTALPNRSPQSCYKYLKRNFNSLNRKGKWTQQQIDRLKILVEKYGRKWTIISKQLKRSSDNCYDKFRQLGDENGDQRVKGIWKFVELVELLKLIQKMTKVKFLDNKIDKQLERAQFHDSAERQEVVSRKYNSKNFIFHNVTFLKPYLNSKNFQKINISQIRWNQIAMYLKTRNTLDCRNKIVQLLQIFFHSQPKQLDEQIVDFIINNKYQNEHEINWKDWNNKHITIEQAKNRYMILKKMVEGRSVKPFKQIVYELKTRLEKKLKQKSQSKGKKQLEHMVEQ